MCAPDAGLRPARAKRGEGEGSKMQREGGRRARVLFFTCCATGKTSLTSLPKRQQLNTVEKWSFSARPRAHQENIT